MTPERDYQRIERAINWIRTHAAEQPSLEDMASAVALSPHHFSRMFRRWAGISPHQFLRSVTLETAKQRLDRASDLMSVALDVGLSGTGRLHDLFVQMEAMSPAEYRRLGDGLRIRFGWTESPFGQVVVAATERGVCAVEFVEDSRADTEAALAARWPAATLERNDDDARRLAATIFTPAQRRKPVHVQGTNFQIQVWRALLRLPVGATVSYGQLARAIGRPGGGRAVGTAVGANPVAFLIPCHRVLRSDGSLGGYRWRAERKAAILAWETGQRSA